MKVHPTPGLPSQPSHWSHLATGWHHTNTTIRSNDSLKITYDYARHSTSKAITFVPVDRTEVAVLLVLAALDISLTFATAASVWDVKSSMYGIYQLNVYLLGRLDIGLLLCGCLSVFCLLFGTFKIECKKQVWFRSMMGWRLLIGGLPSCVLATLLVCNGDYQMVPLLSVFSLVVSSTIWALFIRWRRRQILSPSSLMGLDLVWILSLVFMGVVVALFSANAINFSRFTDCPQQNAQTVPVYFRPVDQWFCASWDEFHVIERPSYTKPETMSCSSTFADKFGVSTGAHEIICPRGCARVTDEDAPMIVGCDLYAGDSSMCLSAIHSGGLTDEGGSLVVLGRKGTNQYSSCLRNSIQSLSRDLSQTDGAALVDETAFTFSLPQTQEYIHLKSFELLDNESDLHKHQPWTRLMALLDIEVAGEKFKDLSLQFSSGTPDDYPDAPVVIDFCQSEISRCGARGGAVARTSGLR